MRVKTDFVTNSSSTCYVLAFNQEELIAFDQFLDQFTNGIHVMQRATTLTELDQIEFDTHEGMMQAKKIMDDGGVVLELDVSDELGYGLIECTKYEKYIVGGRY